LIESVLAINNRTSKRFPASQFSQGSPRRSAYRRVRGLARPLVSFLQKPDVASINISAPVKKKHRILKLYIIGIQKVKSFTKLRS